MSEEKNIPSTSKRAFTVWLTGLSASGKSTISKALSEKLQEHMDTPLYVIDGDYMRRTINKDLGYTRDERNIASERIAYVAKIVNDNGIVCIVNNISQDNYIRRLVREIIGSFYLVFVDTPIEVCAERDPKGHYEKAYSGEIKNFVGIDEKFERPDCADIVIYTLKMNPYEAAEEICSYLAKRGEF